MASRATIFSLCLNIVLAMVLLSCVLGNTARGTGELQVGLRPTPNVAKSAKLASAQKFNPVKLAMRPELSQASEIERMLQSASQPVVTSPVTPLMMAGKAKCLHPERKDPKSFCADCPRR
mmetsp:Transcript_11265/g.15720  ORF Transcript_11265/g.15720 Transcript_11265/m.15720 type:complete len:120 (-) Transcript_11265:164-523(-)|eukprot:CAMPEP_0184487324 /NCGR_PEP_ID=MMETSP0113_2-20130426/9768_1 /TAXON_ID=91329 /ORGANISM="Norrisiella sphaerica, Strain BC52" /LENGTH=119 /DNA_ID=CAMNT_0026869583 /DNA_START=74 /DNA_END=433 /DNA_ORIENTATION=+